VGRILSLFLIIVLALCAWWVHGCIVMNAYKEYYIPKASHRKAIARYLARHDATHYPLREVNGVTGELVRTVYRRGPVTGLRVSFGCWRDTGFDGRVHRSPTELRFERTF
jgi:hypothetical protein